MACPAQSQYIRHKNKSAMIRRWITIILLQSDLNTVLMFSGLDPSIVAGFDTSGLAHEKRDDPDAVRAWLQSELGRYGDETFDESDVFAINTRCIQKSMGLNKVELAVFRFACLLMAYKPLEAATELGTPELSEADVCDLLAELLGLPFGLVYQALGPRGLLRRSGLVALGRWNATQHLTRWLIVPELIAREIFREQESKNLLVNVYYTEGPKSELTQHDFPQRQELTLIKDYLRASIKERAVGANVLIWGPPGTGKTEMARHVAQALRKKPLEINTTSADGNALKMDERLSSYRFCQAILARSSKALLIFDEVEELLSDISFSQFGFRGESDVTKGLINSVLETNKTPAIWITNTVDGVDPAYLRRFDIVVKLDTPVSLIKKKIVCRAFKDLPMKPETVSLLVNHDRITPAHVTKVNRICRRIGVDSPEHSAAIATQVVNGDLRAIRAPVLEPEKKSRKKSPPALPYRPELLNCDTDVKRLSENVSADSSVRICAFGPPGTGKSAWARYLADAVGRPLMVKHAADILDKYLGGTEQKIAEAFEEASDTNSVLMLDEVDGFLPDRASAQRHWEITQANQFLTAMEEFQGILICATNLKDNLDPATMRRFDFKIRFDYLNNEQAGIVAEDLSAALGSRMSKRDRSLFVQAVSPLALSYGDFAVLMRRYSLLKAAPDWRQVVEDLKVEAGFRQPPSRPIGLLANL